MPNTTPTLDAAVADLAVTAEQALAPVVASKLDAFAARGHQIITENLATARVLAATYPAVGALLPVIEGTLRSLLSHLLAGPDAAVPEVPPSRVESAAPVLERRPAEVASDAAAADLTAASTEGLADPAAAFPPIRDDKVPS